MGKHFSTLCIFTYISYLPHFTNHIQTEKYSQQFSNVVAVYDLTNLIVLFEIFKSFFLNSRYIKYISIWQYLIQTSVFFLFETHNIYLLNKCNRSVMKYIAGFFPERFTICLKINTTPLKAALIKSFKATVVRSFSSCSGGFWKLNTEL